MTPFTYPSAVHQRRHGPEGYGDYEPYRPWLRDEFEFRCVYCLSRESWRSNIAFHLDHIVPLTTDSSKSVDYQNLVYACPTCNYKKSSQPIPSPEHFLIADSIKVNEDGTIEGTTDEARTIIERVQLNSAEYEEFRLFWIGIIALAWRGKEEGWNEQLYYQVMGYPNNLPDLQHLRPPNNSRPEGIRESAHARRERRELPVVY